MNTDKVLEKFIDKYWYSPQDVFIRAWETVLWKKIPLKSPVLDIGSGNGSFAQMMLPDRKKIDVGIDINPPQSHKSYKKIIKADATDMPFKNKTFNTVISNSVFEHINKDEEAIKEAGRVLKREGKLYLTVPNKSLEKNVKKYNKRLDHFHYRSPKEWEKILKKANLKPISIKPYFPPAEVKFWLKLFRLSTYKIRNRELWSYLRDSRLSKYLPKKIIKFAVFQVLNNKFSPTYSDSGNWLFITAEKK